jgi:hypothetical protein
MTEKSTERWDDASVLDLEVQFFDENRDDLRVQYPDQFVVIKGNQVLGGYSTFEAAYAAGIERIGNQPMLIRHVDEEDFVHFVPALMYGERHGSS